MGLTLDGKTPVKFRGVRKVNDALALVKIEYDRDGEDVFEEVDSVRLSGKETIADGRRQYVLDLG